MRELHVEITIANIAGRQHGVITVEQLHRAGLDKSAITRWARTGRLHRLYRGVYAVGHTALSREAQWKAATFACEGSALSHRSGTELWKMIEPQDGPIHLTVRTPGGRVHRPGLVIHRCPSLQAAGLTAHDGIPVTRPQQTLIDFSRVADPGELRRAIRQAELIGLPIDALALIGDRTTSELERRFLILCRRQRLPQPEVDVRIGRYRVDFLFREARLIVETDGYRYHRGSIAFEDDRARDNALMALGYDVLRFTWRRIVDEPEEVAALVRQRLARAAARRA